MSGPVGESPARRPASALRSRVASFGDARSRTPHFLGQILELGHAVLDWQHGLLIVDVDARLELQIRNDGGVDIGKSHPGMLAENVAAAGLAQFAVALRRFGVRADVSRAGGDLHCVGRPKRECAYRSCGPMSTRLAMAIANCDRLAADRELDRSAETRTAVAGYLVHYRPPWFPDVQPTAKMASSPRRTRDNLTRHCAIVTRWRREAFWRVGRAPRPFRSRARGDSDVALVRPAHFGN